MDKDLRSLISSRDASAAAARMHHHHHNHNHHEEHAISPSWTLPSTVRTVCMTARAAQSSSTPRTFKKIGIEETERPVERGHAVHAIVATGKTV